MSQAKGVKTNGIGKRTTAHLNLSRTIADVIRANRDVLQLGSKSGSNR